MQYRVEKLIKDAPNHDPWGYGSPFIESRLERSAQFIKKNLSLVSKKNLVEIGAFNGDFTKKIQALFETILCNDISVEAIKKLKSNIPNLNNITINTSNMVDLTNKIDSNYNVITLLECLYYLPLDEQIKVLENISNSQIDHVFISGPINKDYLNEDLLINQMESRGLKNIEIKVLNFKRLNRIYKIIEPIVSRFKFLRKRLAHQTLYYFKREAT